MSNDIQDEEFDIRGEVNVRTVTVTAKRISRDGTTCEVPLRAKCNDLVIGGRYVPIAAFERIPEEPFDGEPLGHVNWWWGDIEHLAAKGYMQLVWVNAEGEARRSILPPDPPPFEDGDVECEPCAQDFAHLPQLYIGD